MRSVCYTQNFSETGELLNGKFIRGVVTPCSGLTTMPTNQYT